MMLHQNWNPAWHERAVSTVYEICLAMSLEALNPKRPMSEEQIGDLGLAYRLAFEDMIKGRGTEEIWSVCVCSLNIAVVLAEWGIGNEYIPKINAALEGAFRAKIRAQRTGKWGLDGLAIMDIREAYAIHDRQIELASKEEIINSLKEVHRRIDEGEVFTEAA
jgi:hypothetical protein